MARPYPGNPKGEQIKPKKTEDTIRKLLEAAAIDASVEEMCFFANISKETYYRWINDDKQLHDEVERLRNKPVLAARMRVVEGLHESYSNAMDYLSRKKKQEFSERKELAGVEGRPLIQISAEIAEKYDLNSIPSEDSKGQASL